MPRPLPRRKEGGGGDLEGCAVHENLVALVVVLDGLQHRRAVLEVDEPELPPGFTVAGRRDEGARDFTQWRKQLQGTQRAMSALRHISHSKAASAVDALHHSRPCSGGS